VRIQERVDACLTYVVNQAYPSHRLQLLKLEDFSSYENVYSGFFRVWKMAVRY
jgi:hypothetical protein